MFTVKINNKTQEFDQPIRVKDLVNDTFKDYPVVLVNNRLRELSYRFEKDATIELLTLDNSEAVHVYEASLRYLIAMAFNRVYPEFKIKFKYSISRSIFCYIVDHEDIDLTPILQDIKHEMDLIIEQDIPFVRATKSKDDTRAFYLKKDYQDKIDILDYRPENRVHLYECEDYLNYMYSYMVPSTGYLKDYKLIPYESGFLIQYPRSETNKQIPLFKDAPKYVDTLRKASEWANVVKADYISNLNNHVESDRTVDFVHMCEAKHNAMLTEIGDKVLNNKDQIRLIAIAGPSSSGKTTFSNRLRIELMTRGLSPVTISLDNYYLNREDIPTDADGKIDLEHINTLDIELFNQNMKDLIDGKEVEMPIFDFHVKKRSGFRKLQVTSDNPIIIEGIHALNKLLTKSIPKTQTFKIYISPQLQMNLDNHNPISLTNLRLIRRIVRDKQFRNADAIRTISMWESVRAGEFKWIYPNQEQADYVYNSGLQYELCVLKKYALPTLKEIPNDSEYYITANRLIKFLKYFVDIEDEVVPNNSLLREFIGGSCFRE